MNSRWIRGGCIAAAIFMVAALFAGAGEAGKAQLFPAPWDKVVHFLYYGAMAVLLGHGVGRRWLWLPLLLIPLVGGLDEWHQAGIPGRDASGYDWVADLLGTLAFVAAYWKVAAHDA